MRRSGKCGGIVALDFSESMIKEAMERAQKDTSVPADNIAFVRADVGRLPFANDSIGGVSASAAIHCWPDVQSASLEIFRVLKPGRIFTGTTFATPNVPFLDDDQNRLLSTLSRDLSASRPGTNGLRFWNSADLRDQLQSVGFSGRDDFTREGLLVLESAKAVMHACIHAPRCTHVLVHTHRTTCK